MNGKTINVIKDIVHDLGWRSMCVVPKILAGRAIHGMDAATIVALDLQNRPFATWPGYASNVQMRSFFKVVNSPDGKNEFLRDKIKSCARCIEYGVPIIPVLAVIGRSLPGDHPFTVIDGKQDVSEFLSDEATPDRLFFKPAGGDSGLGAFSATRAPGGWRVDNVLLTSSELAERVLGDTDEKGTIIQPRASHPAELSPIGAEFGLATMRVQTALTRSGPRVMYIVQKIIGGRYQVDNYSDGAKGNLLAVVDPSSGQLGPAYGLRESRRRVLSVFQAHPATGEAIAGFRVPAIADVVETANRIAEAFPQSPLLGSDLAITTDGVQLVEVNFGPGQNLFQIPGKVSMADMFRDLIPDLAMPTERKNEARRTLASCINKRWQTVRVASGS